MIQMRTATAGIKLTMRMPFLSQISRIVSQSLSLPRKWLRIMTLTSGLAAIFFSKSSTFMVKFSLHSTRTGVAPTCLMVEGRAVKVNPFVIT